MSNDYKELEELEEYLSQNGYPNDGEHGSLLLRVKATIFDTAMKNGGSTMLDLQIKYTALESRLQPYRALGEENVIETLSRLIRYIQQLERTNAELQQKII